MANNYSRFSEEIACLTEQELLWINDVLKHLDVCAADDPEAWLKKELALEGDVDLEYWPEFDWSVESEHRDGVNQHDLWLRSGDGCNYQHVEWFVSAFIHKFRPDFIFSLTNAETCSKLRLGEFGGGWLVVSKEGAWGGNTWDAAHDKVVELERDRERKNVR